MKILPLLRYQGTKFQISNCHYIIKWEKGKYEVWGWDKATPDQQIIVGFYLEDDITRNITEGHWKIRL